MYFVTLFLLYFVALFHDGGNTIIFDNEEYSPLLEYIQFVYDIYTQVSYGFVNIIINGTTNNDIENSLRYFHENANKSITLLNFNDQNAQQKITQITKRKYYMGYLTIVIVFIESSDDLISILEAFLNTFLYQSRGRFFVIIRNNPNADKLKLVFNSCWEKRILNVVVVFLEESNVHAFTYNPFRTEQFLENVTDSRFDKDIFYDKTSNLNGYKLRYLLLKDDDMSKIRMMKNNVTGEIKYNGKDIVIMRNICQRMNASFDILNSGDCLKPGERNPWRHTNELNLNMIEIKKRIITNNRIDLLNTEEMILTEDFVGVTESLYPHAKDDLFIMLRKSEEIPYYLYLFMVLSSELWCAVLVTQITVIAFWTFMVHYKKFSKWQTESLNMVRVIFGGTLPRLSVVNSERIMIIYWLTCSLIISTGFQSKLTSSLMEPKYYPDMKTLNELDASGLNIRTYRTQINEIDKVLNGTSRHGLVKKMVAMPDIFDNADNSKNNFQDFSIFDEPVVINYNSGVFCIRTRIYRKNDRPSLYLIKESILPRFLAFQVSHGSPYLHEMNKLIRRFQESGLFIVWKKLSEHNDVIKNILVPEDYSDKERSEKKKKITILHLQTAFMILAVGLILSGLVFIIEILKNGHMFKRTND